MACAIGKKRKLIEAGLVEAKKVGDKASEEWLKDQLLAGDELVKIDTAEDAGKSLERSREFAAKMFPRNWEKKALTELHIPLMRESGLVTELEGKVMSVLAEMGVTNVANVDVEGDKVKAANTLGNEMNIAKLDKILAIAKGEKLLGSDGIVDIKEQLNTYQEINSEDLINDTDNVIELMEYLAERDKAEMTTGQMKWLKKRMKAVTGPLKQFGRVLPVKLNAAADKNRGWVTLDGYDKGVYIGVGKNTPTLANDIPAAVRYAHELWHAMTYYALTEHKEDLGAELSNLSRVHTRVVTKIGSKRGTEIFLRGRTREESTAEEIQYAEDTWKSISTGKDALLEFIAQAGTNEELFEEMEKITLKELKWSKSLTSEDTIGSWVVAAVEKVLDKLIQLLGRPSSKSKTSTEFMRLTAKVMKANQGAAKAHNSWVGQKAESAIDIMDIKWNGLVGKVEKKLRRVVEPEDLKELTEEFAKTVEKQNVFRLLQWLKLLSMKAMGNPKLKSAIHTITMDIFKHDGMVHVQLHRWHGKYNDYQQELTRLGAIKSTVDNQRSSMRAEQYKLVNTVFGRKLKLDEKSALTRVVMEADLGVLLEDTSRYDMYKLLKNNEYLQDKIDELEEGLSLGEISGSAQLAEYMVTGEPGFMLKGNARLIAGKKAKEEKIRQIDKLTTLRALQRLDQKTKNKVAKLHSTNKEGLVKIATQVMVTKLEADVIEDHNYVKGSHTIVLDNNKTFRVVNDKRKKEMEMRGYRVVKTITKKSIDGGAVYLMESKIAENVTNPHIFDLHGSKKEPFRLHVIDKDVDKKVLNLLRQADRGEYKGPELEGLIPVRNSKGMITGWTYAPSRAVRENIIGEAGQIDDIMAIMADKVRLYHEVQMHNMTAFDKILGDMKKNIDLEDAEEADVGERIIGKNGKSYIRIDNTEDEKLSRLYEGLPGYIRKLVNATPEGLWIRSEDTVDILGFNEISVSNAKFMKKHMPYIFRRSVDLTGKLAEWATKHYVSYLLFRVPEIATENLMSNTMFLLGSGFNIKKTFLLQLDGLKEITFIKNKTTRIEELKVLITTENDNDKRKELEMELEHHINTLKDNGLTALMDAGMYEGIVEDVVLDNMAPKGKVYKKLQRWKDEGKIPGFVYTGVESLYVSSKTLWYKIIHGMMQNGDFISRYAMYRMATEKSNRQFKKKFGREPSPMEKGKMKKEIVNNVRMAFISYSSPDDAKTDWLNRHGVIKFSKYKIRIQSQIYKMVKENPIKSMYLLLFEEMAGIDIPTIVDASFLHSPGLFSPDLGDVIESLIVPASIEAI